MNSTRGENIHETASEVSSQIRVFGGPSNNNTGSDLLQLDLIDADENEIFTLEAYKKLISEARKLDKEFILARVTTSDPNNSGDLFTYFYSAFEINKLLFKYESNRRLLHRMRVKNPLNNMYIIGQVSYYKIVLQEVDRAIVHYYFGDKIMQQQNNNKALSAVIKSSDEKDHVEIKGSDVSKDTNDLITNSSENHLYESPEVEETIKNVENGTIKLPKQDDKEKKIVFDAIYFGSDDDFLVRPEIREYFRKNTTEPENDFLFELDRTNNDVFALLDTASDSESEEASGWKRVLTAHMSILMSMLCLIILFGANPIVLIVALGVALLIFCSLIGSMCYIMCCRRAAFDTLAVQTIDDV